MQSCCFSFHFFCTFFHPVIVWFLPSIFPFPHTLSLLSIVQIFLVLFYFFSIYFLFPFICLLIFLLFLSRCLLYFITHFILLCFPYLHKFIIDSLEKSKGGQHTCSLFFHSLLCIIFHSFFLPLFPSVFFFYFFVFCYFSLFNIFSSFFFFHFCFQFSSLNFTLTSSANKNKLFVLEIKLFCDVD